MEQTPSADESAIVDDTLKHKLDTWNNRGDDLRKFVLNKVVAFEQRAAGVTFEDDDLFDLAA